jgi:signal transduction histidine kinase
VAIDTAAALIAALLAFLLLGRFLQDGRLGDGLLAAALGVLAFSNLFFSALPAATGGQIERHTAWAAVGGRLLGALGFALAGMSGERRVARPRDAAFQIALAASVGIGLAAVISALVSRHLSLGVNPAVSPGSAGHPMIIGSAFLLATQAASALFYALAALAFAARSERTRDWLLACFSIGAMLLSFSSINYFLYISLYSNWVFAGDLFRLASYLVLIAGVAGVIREYQRGLAQAAALEERRRLARELHDGLAQELAFIATQTRWLSRRTEPGGQVEQLVVAAERALDESRSAISALTRPMDEPLDAALTQAAEEVAARVGVRLKLSLEPGIEVPVATREALVRIVREAVSNTARHGAAETVTIELSDRPGVSLRIADDGKGFDADRTDGIGFGLTSMRERARALGGEFNVTSTPGQGTNIEVLLP